MLVAERNLLIFRSLYFVWRKGIEDQVSLGPLGFSRQYEQDTNYLVGTCTNLYEYSVWKLCPENRVSEAGNHDSPVANGYNGEVEWDSILVDA